MNTTELKAEALFQLDIAQKSGIMNIFWDDAKEICFVVYKNGTMTKNDGVSLSIQFELNGKMFVVSLR